MAAGTTPIFCATPRSSGIATGTAANTLFDGTTGGQAAPVTVFTAGANGSKIDEIRLAHMGTNIATVLRLFINNGSASTTAANNTLIHEVTMAANTASQVAAQIFQVLQFQNLVLPAGYKILATIGTAVATGIMVTALGGDY